MAKRLGHPLFLLVLAASAARSSDLQAGLGMRQKRPLHEPEDHRQMVTIDLSALRPSLPGLVLYNYGDQAPKLVQVDLSALNPQLQPHVIWPQFDQMDLFTDRSFEFDDIDSIPYLTDDESLISSSKPLMAKMVMSSTEDESWPGGDAKSGIAYDFIPDSSKNKDLKTLQGRLPVADEVIVPLDWEEEKTNRNSAKRAGFLPRGWRRFGSQREPETPNSSSHTSMTANAGHQTSPSQTNLMAGKREHNWETESEDENQVSHPGKKNVFVAKGWSPSKQQITAMAAARRWGNRRKAGNSNLQPPRSSSQNTWAVPQGYWTVPNLLGGGWQYMEHK